MTLHRHALRHACLLLLFSLSALACSSQPSSGAQGPGTASTSCSSGATNPCTMDDTVTCLNSGTGYSCMCGATPVTLNPALTCSQPTAGPDGEQDFCCTSSK